MLPELPFCKTPKNPIFITVSLKEQYFSPSYVAFFFGFSLSWSELHRENKGKGRTFLPLIFSLPLSLSLSTLSLLWFVLGLWVGLLFGDLMKKMKGVVSVGSTSYAVFEDQRTGLRHQSLLQDYEDLQKDTNAMRLILQAVKQKKMILSAEVRFLRQRYRYLVKNPSPKPPKPQKPQPKPDISQPRKAKIQAHILKGRNYSRKDSTLQPPIASHLNPNERISNGFERTARKTVHMFDLNQNARSLSRTDPSPPSSAAVLDLNHRDMIQSGKEATERCTIPFFDLNQISREEEELLGDTEPTNIEDQKRNALRGMSEELHNDIKLLACRNVGNGSTKTVKRKISWLDQVALRV